MMIQNGGQFEDYIEPATKTVFENFLLTQPKRAGFETEESELIPPDKGICEEQSGEHWETKRG